MCLASGDQATIEEVLNGAMEMLHLAIGMGRVWAAALLLDAHQSPLDAVGSAKLCAIILTHCLRGTKHCHHTLLKGIHSSCSGTISKHHQHT